MLQLLKEIQGFQSKSQGVYPQGIFPSQRCLTTTGIVWEDDNSFFTALIVFTLHRLKKYFSNGEKNIFEDIKHQAQKAFPRYKSKKVEGTYNFWRTEKNAHFPNGNIFSKFNYFALADDADCTALIYITKGYSQDEINHLCEKLIHHSSLPVKISSNTLPQYRNLKLYSTWFGKNIPIEVDICVTANLLYLLSEGNTTLNEYDLDSIKFICSVINNNEHKSQPFRVAPYYPRTSIILYHISRLLTVADNADLLSMKEKLKADIFHELSEKNHPMERVILNTSLIWLGETKNIEEIEMPGDINFPWFIAGMLTSINNPIANRLAPSSLFHLQFYCEAYMKTLYLEYKLERNRLFPAHIL